MSDPTPTAPAGPVQPTCEVCGWLKWDADKEHKAGNGPWCMRGSRHGCSFEDRSTCYGTGYERLRAENAALANRIEISAAAGQGAMRSRDSWKAEAATLREKLAEAEQDAMLANKALGLACSTGRGDTIKLVAAEAEVRALAKKLAEKEGEIAGLRNARDQMKDTADGRLASLHGWKDEAGKQNERAEKAESELTSTRAALAKAEQDRDEARTLAEDRGIFCDLELQTRLAAEARASTLEKQIATARTEALEEAARVCKMEDPAWGIPASIILGRIRAIAARAPIPEDSSDKLLSGREK